MAIKGADCNTSYFTEKNKFMSLGAGGELSTFNTIATETVVSGMTITLSQLPWIM